MKIISDEDLNNLDFTDDFGSHLKNGNSILTGSTLGDGKANNIAPNLGTAACDYLHWIKDNTPYFAEIGTGFWSHSSYMYFRFYKKEDGSLVREWKSNAITGKDGSSKMSSIHELLGVRLLQRLTQYIYENFPNQEE